MLLFVCLNGGMHTPRLCIDGRAAKQFPADGMVAQEVIDQLVASAGEENELTCDWTEKRRTVLLTHSDQLFSGQLRRFNTRHKIGISPMAWYWEKRFVKEAQISAFHRFRPVDRLAPQHTCPMITTVLPAKSGLKPLLFRRRNHRFVVPSDADKMALSRMYPIDREHIFVVRPTTRRYVHFSSLPEHPAPAHLLLIEGNQREGMDTSKIKRILRERFPEMVLKTISLKNRRIFQPTEWMKTLSGARMAVYLTQRGFDWPTLALETIHFGIPTLFLDEHRSLTELLPSSRLTLTRFLVNLPDEAQLKRETELAHEQLQTRGCFDPLRFAEEYKKVYNTLEVRFE